jgi:hypothetical protein
MAPPSIAGEPRRAGVGRAKVIAWRIAEKQRAPDRW